tara:strand:- start:51 stop:350 length:300 start_codon:yes stop_codon:yes gene_type:complete
MNQEIYDLIKHIEWAVENPEEIDLLVDQPIESYISEQARKLSYLCDRLIESSWMLETASGAKFYYSSLNEAHEVGQRLSPDTYIITDQRNKTNAIKTKH